MDSRRDGFRFSQFALLLCMLGMLPATTHALTVPVTLTHQVGGKDNLYYDSWGHPYDGDFVGHPNKGERAGAVELGGSAFNFAGYDFFNVTATGTVMDNGSYSTLPDGTYLPEGAPPGGGDPPGSLSWTLPVYALIGIWSSDPSDIIPLTPFVGDNNPAFYIGSSNQINIPNVPFAYLFLGDNDRMFFDNDGFYEVMMVASVIPLPNALVLLIAGLLPLLLVRRRASA